MGFDEFDDIADIGTKEAYSIWMQGKAAIGKSTLAVEFTRHILDLTGKKHRGVVIPMDQGRYKIYQDLKKEGYLINPVSKDREVWFNEMAIIEALDTNMPGSDAIVISWDSITPGFVKHNNRGNQIAAMSPDERKAITGNTNKISAYQAKAAYMNTVASASMYGTHFIWVAHEHDGRDNKAKKTVKDAVTEQEQLKFRRNLNMILHVGKNNKGHYVEFTWARDRTALKGKRVYDEPNGMFKQIWPEIIQAYEGAEVINWDNIEYFASPQDAWTQAMEIYREHAGQKVYAFKDLRHAENAYNKVKEAVKDITAHDDWIARHHGNKTAKARLMADKWREEVDRRINDKIKIEGPKDLEQPPLIEEPEIVEYQ